jgi:S1-C subfamily serine protease
LGVELAEEQIAKKIGVSGVLIVNVMRGGPAAKAGIRPTRRESSGRVILGDVITAIDGKKVESPNELFITLENYKVGDVVILALLRDGKTIQAKLTLEAVQ